MNFEQSTFSLCAGDTLRFVDEGCNFEESSYLACVEDAEPPVLLKGDTVLVGRSMEEIQKGVSFGDESTSCTSTDSDDCSSYTEPLYVVCLFNVSACINLYLYVCIYVCACVCITVLCMYFVNKCGFFCTLQDDDCISKYKISRKSVYFNLPHAHKLESHAMQMLRGCEVRWWISPISWEGYRLCKKPEGEGDNNCTVKVIEAKFAPFMHAAIAYLAGECVAVRFDGCDLFCRLLKELI